MMREVASRRSFNLWEESPVAFLLLTAQGLIRDANPSALRLLQSTPEDVRQKPLHHFILRDDQKSLAEWLHALDSASTPWCAVRVGQDSYAGVMVHMRATRLRSVADPRLWIVNLVEAFPADRRTGTKADLVFQSAVLDSIGEAVIATDLPGHILYWNRAAERIYGWRAEEVLGRNILDVTPGEDNKDRGVEIMTALQAGQTWSGEFLVRHRDGHRFPAYVTDTCLRNQDGELSVIIGVSSDLTERKRLENDLYEQKLALVLAEKSHLEEVNRFKSEFIANMSHEIRTPLAIIRGYAEILMENDHSSSESIQTILKASRQVEMLVNDILDLSKVEAGKIAVDLLPTTVASLLNEVKDTLSLKAHEKNLGLHFVITPGVPPVIQTDPVRLKQILLNVIGNAIKFTDAGSVTVTVHMQRGPQDRLAFSVQDTGIGMTPAQSQRIFSAYTQADASITRKYGGTGLGLALSRKLAQLLGGDLILEKTEPGQGSLFTITIYPGVVSERLPKGRRKDPPRNYHELSLRDLKVLVIEDAVDIRAIVRQVLEKQGALVTEASQGQEGLHLAQSQPFDAILMDLQMPILDGLTTTRLLRAGGYDRPIFALTAHAMTGERERCFEAGFNGYLTKPINFRTMIETLQGIQPFAPEPRRSNGR